MDHSLIRQTLAASAGVGSSSRAVPSAAVGHIADGIGDTYRIGSDGYDIRSGIGGGAVIVGLIGVGDIISQIGANGQVAQIETVFVGGQASTNGGLLILGAYCGNGRGICEGTVAGCGAVGGIDIRTDNT